MSQRRTRPERTTGHGDLLENGEPIARVDYAINVMHFVLNTRAVGGGNQPREGIPSVSGSFWVTDGVTELAGRKLVIRLADAREFLIMVAPLPGPGQYRIHDREATAA